jgi:putative ubiquitin-RnfH superfamily antitoxin RatB of RatAB toxin-antitoxin module
VSSSRITIEVIYALPGRQVLRRVELPAGATLAAAIAASGLLQEFPEIDLARNQVGVYGKLAPPDFPLRDRDRIEIYRPLAADPKEARRARAAPKSRRQ